MSRAATFAAEAAAPRRDRSRAARTIALAASIAIASIVAAAVPSRAADPAPSAPNVGGAAAGGSRPAEPASERGNDRLVRRDGSELRGTIVSLSLSDVGFHERDGGVLLVPRVEVHRLVYADGREIAGGPLYPKEENLSLRAAYVREVSRKPHLIESKLTLSKAEIAERSLLRGFLVGGVITLFANGEAKKIAFPVGFASQFLLAYIAGQ
jgi:hypothetical protein